MTMLVMAAALAATESCTVTGRVVDAFTGEALTGVEVRGEGGITRTVAGDFTLELSCAPRTELVFKRLDYEPAVRRLNLERDASIDVALEPREVSQIDDVIVEAPAPAVVDPRSSITLDSEALRETRGRSLADSLAEIPGVATLRAGTTSKPIIRGQQGRRVLIVFDGIRHESQKWGLEHAPELDPFAAGAITVIKGAAGVRYGPDAIGGVVLMEPHAFGEPGIHGTADQIVETNGRQGTLALRLDGVDLVEGLSLRLEGNAQARASLSAPDYPLENTGGRTWNAGVTARWQTEDFELELSARRYAFESGIYEGLGVETPETFFATVARGEPLGVEQFTVSYDYDRPYQAAVHDLWIGRGRGGLGAYGELELSFGFQDDARQEFDIARASVTGPQADFSLRTSLAELAWHQPVWGLGEGYELSGTVGITGWRQANVYRGLPLIPNYRNTNLGAFVIERLRAGAFDVEVGARLDAAERNAFLSDNAFEAQRRQERLDDDSCDFDGGTATCPSDFRGTSASLGVTWRASELGSVSAELSTATRFPTIDEQFINGTAPSFPAFAVGDPELGTETTFGGSVTGRVELDWLVGEVSLWGQRIEDYIYFAPALTADGQLRFDVLINGSFPRFEFTQLDAEFWGGEGAATVRPFSVPFEIEVSAAVVRGQGADGRFLVLVPPDRGRIELRYGLADLLSLDEAEVSLNVSHVRGQGRVDLNADFAPPPEAYTLMGLRASAGFTPWDVQMRASVEVTNLLNVAYRDYTSLLRYFADEPGRSVVLRVGQDF